MKNIRISFGFQSEEKLTIFSHWFTMSYFKNQSLNSTFLQLTNNSPSFALNANNVKIIETPNDFYTTLLVNILLNLGWY